MGRRRQVLEGAAERLADHLGAAGSDLREAIPHGAIANEDHLPALAIRLKRIVDGDWADDSARTEARRLLEVIAHLPDAIGRCGDVHVMWSAPSSRAPAPTDARYHCVWYDDDFCGETTSGDLDEALAWARERSDRIFVRPSWDPDTLYWAGRGGGDELVPVTSADRVRLAPLAETARAETAPAEAHRERRTRTSPPYVNHLDRVSWRHALEITDQMLLQAVIERGEAPPSAIERQLRWLAREVGHLLADLDDLDEPGAFGDDAR